MFAKFIKIFFTIIFLFLNFFTISFAKNDKAYVEHEKLSLELISSVKSINNKSNLYTFSVEDVKNNFLPLTSHW